MPPENPAAIKFCNLNKRTALADQIEIFKHELRGIGLFCVTQPLDAEILFPIDVATVIMKQFGGLLVNNLSGAFDLAIIFLEMDSISFTILV